MGESPRPMGLGKSLQAIGAGIFGIGCSIVLLVFLLAMAWGLVVAFTGSVTR